MIILNLQNKNCFELDKEESLRKVAKLFYAFLTTPDEEKKYAELIDKSEARIMMHSHTSDYWARIHKIKILNHFDPESQLTRICCQKEIKRFVRIDKVQNST